MLGFALVRFLEGSRQLELSLVEDISNVSIRGGLLNEANGDFWL